MVEVLIQLQGTILVYMGFGFILRKTHMIDEQASSFLSTFILEFILPINIFNSCLQSFSFEKMNSFLVLFILAIGIECILFCVTRFNILKVSSNQLKVVRYGLLVSNGGLIGTPVIEGLYGACGVMVANIFLIPQRILAYTAGKSIFNPNQKRRTIKEIILNFCTNHVVLALVIGILLAGFNVQIPTFIHSAIQNTSKCMSPLSLILVGSLLANDLKFKLYEDLKIIGLSIYRQIIIPVLLMFILKPMNFDPLSKSIMILLIGMPIASTTAIYASQYHNEEGFASKAVFISTLSSTITLVLLMALIENFIM